MAYLTFEILSSGNINWCSNNNTTTHRTIQYRKNGGEWTSITSSQAGVDIAVVAGDVLEFKGDNATYSDANARFGMFGDGKTTAQFKVSGNIMSIINSTDFENLKSFTQNYVFRAFFNRCDTMMDASELVMPATGLTTGCYRFMFQACSNIATAPKLPATTLVSECYQGMFLGCSSLNKIECLATSITASNCTSNWVSGVSSTGIFIKNPDITASSWGRGISKIPSNWTIQDKVMFSIEPDALGFAYSGETKTAVLESESPWTATVPSWVTLSPSSGVSGSSVSLTCSANRNYGLRIGYVVFTDGDNSATLTVSQEGDKSVILKNLYRNGSSIKMMFRNGAFIYRCIEKKQPEQKVLPNKSFVFNFNAKNYNTSTYTIPNESGATMNMNMVFSGTSSSVINNISFDTDHISVPKSGYSLFDFSTSGANPMNNTVDAPAMTIIAKFKVTDTSSGANLICNRDNSTFNYMVRTNENGNGALSLSTSGGTILGPAFTTGNTVIAVWRVNANREIDIKNLTNETSSQPVTSSWNTGSKWFSFFMRKRSTTATDWNEPMACDFYWCYASKEYLTDEEIQQVLDFNEN